ncbi:MAG: hypothetical protein HZC43_06245 [Nitrosomonadales bacterium]|nr:hypothetical protein [Nitrosomonadales bacterium]
MELHETVMKLIGPVRPLGEHNADQARLANMKILTELTDRLLYEISSVEHNADRCEDSMKAIGKHAREFMASVRSA